MRLLTGKSKVHLNPGRITTLRRQHLVLNFKIIMIRTIFSSAKMMMNQSSA